MTVEFEHRQKFAGLTLRRTKELADYRTIVEEDEGISRIQTPARLLLRLA